MPDLSPQRLHEIMSPVWDVWLELQPTGLKYHGGSRMIVDDDGCPHESAWQWTLHGEALIDDEGLVTATDLCIARMVEGLMHEKVEPLLDEYCEGMEHDYIVSIVRGFPYERRKFTAPTLVEALASACIAFKAAQEVSDG